MGEVGSPAVRRIPRQQSFGLYDYPRRGVPVPTPALPASRELAWCSVAQLRVRDQGPYLESRWASKFNNNSDIATGACVLANSDMPMRVGEAQGLGSSWVGVLDQDLQGRRSYMHRAPHSRTVALGPFCHFDVWESKPPPPQPACSNPASGTTALQCSSTTAACAR